MESTNSISELENSFLDKYDIWHKECSDFCYKLMDIGFDKLSKNKELFKFFTRVVYCSPHQNSKDLLKYFNKEYNRYGIELTDKICNYEGKLKVRISNNMLYKAHKDSGRLYTIRECCVIETYP